jgi:transcriptional regulator with GAF, ATPase, and Fis domain
MQDGSDTEKQSSTLQSQHRGLVETFVALADTLVDDFDVVEFLSMLTSRVVELSIATEAGILLADETGDLQVMAASKERTRSLELFQIQNAEGPCQECFTTGRPVEVLDLELERDRWPLFAPRALEVGFRSVQAVPMRLRGEVLGAMNLFIAEPGGIDPADRTLVQALADIATIGLLQRRTTLNAQLHLGQVQHALHSRIVIEQAKGILAQQAGIPIDDAFDRLRTHSRSHNWPLHDLALAVINGEMTTTGLATDSTAS